MTGKKSSETCQEARDGELLDGSVRSGRQAGMPMHSAAPFDVLLPKPHGPADGVAPTRA